MWKSPSSFEEVKMIVGPTRFTNITMAVEEINKWLEEKGFACKTNQLKVKWWIGGSRNVSFLSADPSIKVAVTAMIEQHWTE
jgi:hypothetical protein